jgi:AraC-like DNA-binding protein
MMNFSKGRSCSDDRWCAVCSEALVDRRGLDRDHHFAGGWRTDVGEMDDLDDLGRTAERRAGLGHPAFSARFTSLVGQPMHRYFVARRMNGAALMLESSDEAIARIATRVGYETTAAFSKVFHRHHGFSPGRYRAGKGIGRAS